MRESRWSLAAPLFWRIYHEGGREVFARSRYAGWVSALFSTTPAALVRRTRLRLAVLAALLGLAAPASAQFVVTSFGECVDIPEEGIFCGEEPPPFELFWFATQTIVGEVTEPWYVSGQVSTGFTYNRLGLNWLVFDYTLTAGSRLTIAGSGGMYYRGTIQGPGSLRLLAGGSLTFDPTDSFVYQQINSPYSTFYSRNTYSGGTEIAGGWLKIYDDASLGTGALTLSDGGRLQTLAAGSLRGFTVVGNDNVLQTDHDLSVDGVIAGDGRLNKQGAGTLTLTQTNTYADGTHVAEGALAVSTDANLGAADTRVSLASGTALRLADGFASSQRELELQSTSAAVSVATGTATWHGVTAGSGQLVKQGSGTLTLAGGIGHTGGADIAAGTLEVSVSSSLGGTGTTSWSGPITGSGALVKSGEGTLVLTGADSHSGATVVRGGTLQTGAANVLSSNSAYFLIGGSTLDLAGHDQTVGDLDSYNVATQQTESSTVNLGGATLTNLNRVLNLWAGSLTGHGTLVKKGSTEMKWYAANTFTGTLQIDAGTVSAQAANVFSPNATVSLASGSTLQLNSHAQTTAGLSGSGNVALGSAALTLAQSADATFSGILSGTGSLTKNGAGILTLAGVNTYSGGTTLRGGTLRIAADSALGNATGALTFDGGALQTTANFSSARAIALAGGGGTVSTDADTTATLSGILSGSGSFTKIGSGTLTLAAANTYSGGTTLRGGTLRIAADSALGNATGALTFDGGTLHTTATLSSARAIALAANGGTVSTAADTTTTLSGVLSGAGALTKTGAGTLALTATNTYSGATTVSAGTLRAGAANSFSAASAHTVASGATLDLAGFNQTLAGLSGAGSVALGSAALTVNSTADSTFSGVISGTGALTKSGSAALTLAGDSTYSGGTTIAAGTLVVGHASALGTGAISLDSGATLDLGSYALDLSRLSGNGRLISAQSHTFSNSTDTAFAFALGGSASIEKSGAGTLTLAGANTYSGGTTLSAGTLALASNTALGTGTLTLDGGTLRADGAARTLANAVVLNADTTIAGTERLTVTGNFALARNRDLTIDTGATLAIAGGITQNGGPRALLKYGDGTLELTGASTYTGGTTIAAGIVRINNATGSAFGTGAVTIAADGTLTGAGVFSGALQNDGVYAPGNSPTLASISAFSQGATGLLEMEIAGLARGTGYDALDIADAVSLGGTLEIVTYGAFTPASFSAGQSFDLFNWGSVTGTFSTLRLPDLAAYGLTWDTSALYTTGVLSVAASAVPEPSTYALFTGLVILGFSALRRRREK